MASNISTRFGVSSHELVDGRLWSHSPTTSKPAAKLRPRIDPRSVAGVDFAHLLASGAGLREGEEEGLTATFHADFFRDAEHDTVGTEVVGVELRGDLGVERLRLGDASAPGAREAAASRQVPGEKATTHALA